MRRERKVASQLWKPGDQVHVLVKANGWHSAVLMDHIQDELVFAIGMLHKPSRKVRHFALKGGTWLSASRELRF